MWALTNFGFFSAVQRTDKVPADDNRTLQVRSRDPKQLDELRDRYMGDELGPTMELDFRDYQARAYCTPEAWGRALYAASQDIDYSNFKDSVKDNKLHNAYMKVWSALANAYGTAYGRGKTYAGKGWSTAGSSSAYSTGRYESAFGVVEGQDATAPMYRSGMSAAKMIEKSDKVYDDFSDAELADILGYDDRRSENDLFPEHSVQALLDKYAPFVEPENTPNLLSRAAVVQWLGSNNSLFRKFLAGNQKWRSYKNGSQNRYEFPKAVMGELQEHYDIWLSEKHENEMV